MDKEVFENEQALLPSVVGCVRLKILRLTGFLDIKANKKRGESEGQISKRLLRLTEIEGGGIWANSKKVGNFFINLSWFTRKSSQIT